MAKKTNKPYCSWHVKYVSEGLTILPSEGEELEKYFAMLEKYQPVNMNIRDVTRWSNATILEYGDCQCARPVF